MGLEREARDHVGEQICARARASLARAGQEAVPPGLERGGVGDQALAQLLALGLGRGRDHPRRVEARERALRIDPSVTQERADPSGLGAWPDRLGVLVVPGLPDLVELGEFREVGVRLAHPPIDPGPAREHVEAEVGDRKAGPAQDRERGDLVLLVGPQAHDVDEIPDLGQQQQPAPPREIGRDPPTLERRAVALGQAPARDQDREVAGAQGR
ncbi:hypothetical protein ENSA5_66260 [Enhygromyxa salina]|uniref:Uncharacterized protein n=1 Tax=Enhygromyxa salina TaxID=215803 RepID=A0A2S9XC54_9BACT|nr:hypothetical protein ENSA5_66260 [Enhygromyxa salina]